MQRKRSQWIETISGANAEHQIYLDESGINTNLTRHYAHAVHGKRAMDIGIANAGDGKLIPVDGFKGVHAQLDAREEFRHGFLDGNFLFYRFPWISANPRNSFWLGEKNHMFPQARSGYADIGRELIPLSL